MQERYISSGSSRLHIAVWEPSGERKAIMQISHGMIEYIKRYSHFADYLNQAGILVIGNDHKGHGLTAEKDEDLGYFGEEKSAAVIEDLHEVTRYAKEQYGADVPYFLFGHSMGSFMARRYLMTYGEALARLLPEGWLLGGGLLSEGRLVAMSLAEKCGDTLIIHVEKALYSHQGAYPTLVQAFAAHFGGDCTYINREDDAGDQGLRTSKLQYLPVRLAGKLRFEVRCEADRLREIPTLTTPRLTLTPLEDRDEAAYNTLCLDDDRNRWWGYDFRQDLKGELTEDYFLSVARHDFAARQAVNFAVRLDGHLIGEAVLYRFDWRGGAELGCRIDRAYAGHGYGTEAFTAAAEWALFGLTLAKVKAKCYKENTASYKMLSSCMRPAGEDDTFFYFEKTV